MRIDYIEFKNFASYGNQAQRIEFEEDQSKLFLTLGKNGDGKTTIANAIIYALYGRVEGVKLSDLPNRINKELHVKIGLMCGTVSVEIERGLAPNKFSVKLNGVEFDKAGKKSVQDYLEEEVFGIPYHVFKNIIILSINDFKSFLTMNNSDKRQIIDRMFGFSILNDMQKQIKEERKQVKMDIDTYESELNQLLESIKSVRGKLNTLLEESNTANKSKIEELKEGLLSLKGNVEKLDAERKNHEGEMNKFNSQYNDKHSDAKDIKREIDYLKKKLALYESGHCPTCETKLDSEWHTNQKCEFEENIKTNSNDENISKEYPMFPVENENEILNELKPHKVAVRTLPGLSDIATGKVSLSDLRELDIDDLLGREPVKPNGLLLNLNTHHKTVLVTGAGGSIGSELCRQILKTNPK